MLKLSEEEIDPEKEMSKFGLDSLIGVRLINRIQDAYGIRLSPEVLIRYESLGKLARYLTDERGVAKIADKDDDEGLAAEAEGDVELDEFSDAELDELLKRHIADQQN